MSTPDLPGPPESEEGSSPVEELAQELRAASGETVEAILLYGSHLLGTRPDRHSAVDFVVIVNEYRPFYAALAGAGQLHRPVGVMTALARRLPPNVLAFAPDDGRRGIAKYLLIRRADFELALGEDRRDHFLLARLIQRIGIVWTRGPEVDAWVRRCIEGAHAGVLDWVAPYLGGPVDVDGFGRRMLEVCYAGEFRPESAGRAERVYDAQAEHMRSALEPVLERAVVDGAMARDGDLYVLAAPVEAPHRRRIQRYFRRSKARTTARWLKHTVTFVNWLPYIVRKVERHTGRRIELTALERAVPVIFLWPRVIHVLLTRPRKEIET